MKRDALTSFQLLKMKKLDSDWRSGGIGRRSDVCEIRANLTYGK